MTDNSRLNKVLIANRGEIALRAIRVAQSLGISTVAVYSSADRNSAHVLAADESVCIGPPAASKSYLLSEGLLHVAKQKKCDSIYPGYGFLSESSLFANRCEKYKIKFIGPSSSIIENMGNKDKAREIAASFGVPIVPGSDRAFTDCSEALISTKEIGFPLLLKARSGGGGRGMRIVFKRGEFKHSFGEAMSEAAGAFGDGALYIEKFFPKVRHIEIQVLGDGFGKAIVFDERDCSVQRRHQKLIEESPSPMIGSDVRRRLKAAAIKLARGIKYEGAGTIEFVLETMNKEFFFIEMNTRIQVEHPVTEMRNDVDLVKEQFKIGLRDQFPDETKFKKSNGHSIEFRINAEDPENNFSPSPGLLKSWYPPNGEGIRVDSSVTSGSNVSPYYDSMIAKLIVHDTDRSAAIKKARDALSRFYYSGVKTTIPFYKKLLHHDGFLKNKIHTRWIEEELMNEDMGK